MRIVCSFFNAEDHMAGNKEENTENERKFVLTPTFSASALKQGWTEIPIRQGYIEQPRLRQEGSKFLFTFKHMAQDGKLVEIETDITEADFNRLWPDCKDLVHKTRFEKEFGDETWMVDFLKDESSETYFIMAEAEMPEGRDMPNSMPDEIKNDIIYVVERNDERFTNKNLSDKSHAQAMLQWIAALPK